MFPTSNVTFTRKNKCTWFTKLLSRKLRYNPFHLRTSFLARASFLKTRRRIRHNLLPYTLFPHEISVWSIHRALNRVCHTISTRKGGSKAKKNDCMPFSLPGRRDHRRNVMDFCDPLPSHSFMRLYILLLIPSSLLSNWEIPDGSVSSSYSAVLCTPAGPNLRLFTLSSSSYLLHSGHK